MPNYRFRLTPGCNVLIPTKSLLETRIVFSGIMARWRFRGIHRGTVLKNG